MTDAPLIWPMPRLSPSRLPVISDGYSHVRTAKKRQHLGVDVMFRWREGDPRVAPFTASTRKGVPLFTVPRLNIPIVAVAGGTVLYAKVAANGWRTRLELDDGRHILDLHMTRLVVQKGQRVRQGDVLGMCGGDPTDHPRELIHDHHEHRRPASAEDRRRGHDEHGVKVDGWGCLPYDPAPELAMAVVLDVAVLA